MKIERRIIVYQDEAGEWCVLCPSLGAFTQGESRSDAIENMKELLPIWIDEEYQDQPIPEDNGHIETVTVMVEPHRT